MPASKFSYVLQDWDQLITTEQPYRQVSRFLEKILGLRQHVDSLERMSRHLVKDRLERTGMNWTKPGAQAVLSLRAIYVGGHWDKFIQYRMEREAARLYPHRAILRDHQWTLAL